MQQVFHQYFNEVENKLFVEFDNIQPSGHKISTDQMVAPRLIIYTDKLYVPYPDALQTFKKYNILMDIINESQIEEIAKRLIRKKKSKCLIIFVE